MKLITAIVKPDKVDAVREALLALGVVGMTVTEVRGCGRQKGHTEMYRGAEYQMAFVPKMKLEIAVTDDNVPGAVDAIRKTAQTGAIGDGKIFILPMDDALRIRTGEAGDQAL